MGEILPSSEETTEPNLPERSEIESNLPKIPSLETHLDSLREQIPFIPPRKWKETLDSIALGWKKGEENYNPALIEFDKALSLPNIPEEEKAEVMKLKQEYTDKRHEFFTGVFEIASNNKLKWSRIRELGRLSYYAIGEVSDPADEQALALLHAISETHYEGRKEEEVRQKIAQHAFEEVFQVGAYRVYEWSGADFGDDVDERSTQDFFEEEKGELISALHKPLWDSAKTTEMSKTYKGWAKIATLVSNSLDQDDIDLLEELWDFSRGKNLDKTNSLEILQMAEAIYRRFEESEAFDIEIDTDEDTEDENV